MISVIPGDAVADEGTGPPGSQRLWSGGIQLMNKVSDDLPPDSGRVRSVIANRLIHLRPGIILTNPVSARISEVIKLLIVKGPLRGG